MARVKAISIKQPAASKIARSEKTIEVRTWYTSYRGPILIVSSKSPSNQGPTGVALAIVDIADCRPMTAVDEAAACCESESSWFSWVLTNVRTIADPFAVRGQLGMYEVELPDAEQYGVVSSQLPLF